MSKFANGLVVFAGVVSLPISGGHADSPKPPIAEHRTDRRLVSLRTFFAQSNCPAAKLSPVFLKASDANDLDWRLLPSISFVESTGGKCARNNNLFGWDSGRAEFPSATASIESVAYSLGNSALYRDKDTDEILSTYNPDPDYKRKVKWVMRRIAALESVD
jgi:hypothetical protein